MTQSITDRRKRGQAFIRMPLKQQPYGDWEFEVRDPNGYILVLSELIE